MNVYVFVTDNHCRFMSLLILIIASVVTTSATGNNPNDCLQNVSGIYLRRYTSGNSNANVDYAFVLYLPFGDVLQFDAGEKQNASNYFSDLSGYFDCEIIPGSDQATLTFTGIFFGESGNDSVTVVRSTSVCTGATSSCSDDEVHCLDGQARSQTFKLELPDLNTGVYSNPILNSNLTRQFQSLGLYTHSSISADNRNICYSDLSGVYVIQYSDGTYALAVYSSLGYLISVASDARTPDDMFTVSTTVGIWYCTDSLSVSGTYNYFTYSNRTTQQSIVSSSYYHQCVPGQYNNCTGLVLEISYPLQYQYTPLQSGQSINSPPQYTSSLLFEEPTIKSCHTTFAGVYTFETIIGNGTEITFITFTFFRNAVAFVAGSFETDPRIPHSNIVCLWDCDDNGNVTIHVVHFRYGTTASKTPTIMLTGVASLKCDNTTGECAGTITDIGAPLQLPVNGKFPNITLGVTGTLRGRRVELSDPL
jgi:hypothetical protein